MFKVHPHTGILTELSLKQREQSITYTRDAYTPTYAAMASRRSFRGDMIMIKAAPLPKIEEEPVDPNKHSDANKIRKDWGVVHNEI